jgi:hypothetical protein
VLPLNSKEALRAAKFALSGVDTDSKFSTNRLLSQLDELQSYQDELQ